MIAYHLVIFDFDGTVVDTKDCIAGTVNSTLVKYGIRPREPAAIHDLIGLTLDELFETLTRSERERPQLAMLVDTYRHEYNRVGAPNTMLFPGVLETLQGLLERKIPMAIATSKGIEGVLLSLDALHIRDYFAHIVTEASVSRKKPLPEMVLRILDATGISAERAIVVGDTVHDIRMGKAAGTATCAVTYGCHNARQLASEAPTFLVQNGFELRRMLMEPSYGSVNMNSGECYVSNWFQCEPYPVFDDENRIRRAIEAVRVGNSTTTYLKVRKSQRLPPSNFGLWHFCDMAAMNLHPVLCLAGTDVAGHDLILSMSLRHAEP